MAAFKEHIKFSCGFGCTYAAGLAYLGAGWTHSIMAGAVCGISGMLPDLDSASGRPVREMFGLTAAIVPLLMLPRLQSLGLTVEQAILIFAVVYVAIRFGLSSLFKRLTVHRGMFHSIPAALIAAEVGFLVHHCDHEGGAWLLAGGVFLGFLSHLILDEIYSVDSTGALKKSAGTAIKFASKSIPANLTTYTILAALTYVVVMDLGYVRPLDFSIHYLTGQEKAVDSQQKPLQLPPRTIRPVSTEETPLNFKQEHTIQ